MSIFSCYLWFRVNNLLSMWFHVKLLKLRESDINQNSQLRTEVKRDSVKWQKLISSVNFLWIWIHWPITNWNIPKYLDFKFLSSFDSNTFVGQLVVFCYHWKQNANVKELFSILFCNWLYSLFPPYTFQVSSLF